MAVKKEFIKIRVTKDEKEKLKEKIGRASCRERV